MSIAVYPGGLSRAQVLGWRNAVFVIFAACGMGIASLMARTPSVKEDLSIRTDQLGVLIFGLAIGSITGLIASSHVISWFGTRKIMKWCLVFGPLGLATAGVGISVLHNFAAAFVGLAIFGAVMSLCDVAMNLSGAVNERVLGKSIMPVFHAFFSFGTMLGAGAAAVAAAAGISVAVQSAVIAAVILVAGAVSVPRVQSEHVLAIDESGETPADTWRTRLSMWTDSRTLLIGLIVLGMAFAEGTANDWLALTMVDGYGVGESTGALIFGVFVTAMTVGRLAGVKVLDRFGRVPVLRASAALAVIGLLVVIYGPGTVTAVVGVILWGLGSALGFPTGMSAAADDPRTAAARVSAVATIGYLSFLVGPPAIGFLGEQNGLRNTLLIVLVLVVVAGLVSHAAREPAQKT